jgi:hypothetical protein
MNKNEEIITRFVNEFSTDDHNILTPFVLCDEILNAIGDDVLQKADNILVFSNLEFLYKIRERKIESNLYFLTGCPKKGRLAHKMTDNVIVSNIDELNINMKFDVIVGNPPYQKKVGLSKTEPIWQKFVTKSFKHCKEGGTVALIHPSGWRNVAGKFKATQELLKSKNMKYLEIHDENDGLKTFKVSTRYDWYIVENKEYGGITEILCKGKTHTIDFSKWDFIPSGEFNQFERFLAKAGEECVDILYDSAYHTQREHMSKIQTDEFKYPCVYSTPIEKPTMWYSNTNKIGHFGVSKFIFNPSRPTGYVMDEKGEYGMSQFCIGIVGDPDYLNLVEKVYNSKDCSEFSNLMESTHFTDKIFDCRVFRNLRKHVWKEFKY